MAARRNRTSGHAAPKPTLDLVAIEAETNRVSADFLKTDLLTALTFAKAARETNDGFRRRRSSRAARQAYNTIANLALRVDLTADDSEMIKLGLAQLQTELKALGETF